MIEPRKQEGKPCEFLLYNNSDRNSRKKSLFDNY
jgi:hypothetical protein